MADHDPRETQQGELDRKKEINLERAWIQICEMEDRQRSRGLGSTAEPIEELSRRIVPRIYQIIQKENIISGSGFTTRAPQEIPRGNPKDGERVITYLVKKNQDRVRYQGFRLDSRTEGGPGKRAGESTPSAGDNGGSSVSLSTNATEEQETKAGSILSPKSERALEKKIRVKPLSDTSTNRILFAHQEIPGWKFDGIYTRKVAMPLVPPTKGGVAPQKVVGPTSCSESYTSMNIGAEPDTVGSPMRIGEEPTLWTPNRPHSMRSCTHCNSGLPSRVSLRTQNRLLTAYSYTAVEDAFKMSQQRSVTLKSPRRDKHSSTAARGNVNVTTCCIREASPLGRFLSFVFKYFCCGCDAFRAKQSPTKFGCKLGFQTPIVDFKSRCTTPTSKIEKVSSSFAQRLQNSPLRQKESSLLRHGIASKKSASPFRLGTSEIQYEMSETDEKCSLQGMENRLRFQNGKEKRDESSFHCNQNHVKGTGGMDVNLQTWAPGKEKDVRAFLSSSQYVLRPRREWTPGCSRVIASPELTMHQKRSDSIFILSPTMVQREGSRREAPSSSRAIGSPDLTMHQKRSESTFILSPTMVQSEGCRRGGGHCSSNSPPY